MFLFAPGALPGTAPQSGPGPGDVPCQKGEAALQRTPQSPPMKNVVFLFQGSTEDTPQVAWAVQEYIDPGVHQVLLVYVLSDKLLLLNDPRALANSIDVLEHEEKTRRAQARRRLESVHKSLLSEFSEELHITKLVVCGEDREKLRLMLTALDTSLVILGPDTAQGWLAALFCESIDDFLAKRLRIPVLRVPLGTGCACSKP